MSAGLLQIRAAETRDTDALFGLAAAAGQGLTNLPPCREGLHERLAASEAAFASEGGPGHEQLILALDQDGAFHGTGCIFPKVGVDWPFYSYRIGKLRQTSTALAKTVDSDLLVLVNDYDGCVEVGGLLVDPALRGVGAGRMMARSRYLFLAEHRDWFGPRVISELRGWHRDGRSPFWEAVGRPFYQMDFADADRLGVGGGKQMIADLGPKHPIYLNLLPQDARDVVGRAHEDGAAAERLLIQEGFRFEGCVDIFDGGPTMAADIDALKTVRDSARAVVIAIREPAEGTDSLVSTGHAAAFRAARGRLSADEDGGVNLAPALAEALELNIGDEVRHVVF